MKNFVIVLLLLLEMISLSLTVNVPVETDPDLAILELPTESCRRELFDNFYDTNKEVMRGARIIADAYYRSEKYMFDSGKGKEPTWYYETVSGMPPGIYFLEVMSNVDNVMECVKKTGCGPWLKMTKKERKELVSEYMKMLVQRAKNNLTLKKER